MTECERLFLHLDRIKRVEELEETDSSPWKPGWDALWS